MPAAKKPKQNKHVSEKTIDALTTLDQPGDIRAVEKLYKTYISPDDLSRLPGFTMRFDHVLERYAQMTADGEEGGEADEDDEDTEDLSDTSQEEDDEGAEKGKDGRKKVKRKATAATHEEVVDSQDKEADAHQKHRRYDKNQDDDEFLPHLKDLDANAKFLIRANLRRPNVNLADAVHRMIAKHWNVEAVVEYDVTSPSLVITLPTETCEHSVIDLAHKVTASLMPVRTVSVGTTKGKALFRLSF